MVDALVRRLSDTWVDVERETRSTAFQENLGKAEEQSVEQKK